MAPCSPLCLLKMLTLGWSWQAIIPSRTVLQAAKVSGGGVACVRRSCVGHWLCRSQPLKHRIAKPQGKCVFLACIPRCRCCLHFLLKLLLTPLLKLRLVPLLALRLLQPLTLLSLSLLQIPLLLLLWRPATLQERTQPCTTTPSPWLPAEQCRE